MWYIMVVSMRVGITSQDIERKLSDDAIGWYRMAPNAWLIISTQENSEALVSRVERLMKSGGSVFVARLSLTDSQGLMNPDFWKFIKESNQ